MSNGQLCICGHGFAWHDSTNVGGGCAASEDGERCACKHFEFHDFSTPPAPAPTPDVRGDSQRIKRAIRQIAEIAVEHRQFGGHKAVMEAIAEIDDASDRLAIRALASARAVPAGEGTEIERLQAELAEARSMKAETVEEYKRWLEGAAKHDVATLSDWDSDELAETLESIRAFAPAACHAALNVAAYRLRAGVAVEVARHRFGAEHIRDDMTVVNIRTFSEWERGYYEGLRDLWCWNRRPVARAAASPVTPPSEEQDEDGTMPPKPDGLLALAAAAPPGEPSQDVTDLWIAVQIHGHWQWHGTAEQAADLARRIHAAYASRRPSPPTPESSAPAGRVPTSGESNG